MSDSSPVAASPPLPLPPAAVASGAGGLNVLSLPGIAGVLLGNYDRRAETEGTPAEYRQRVLRPGAILLANLDLSGPLDPSRPRFEQLDALDLRVNDGDDSNEMATLKVRRPSPCNVGASKVALHIHPDDARRIHVFPHGAQTPVLLGNGKTAQSHETVTAARNHELEISPVAQPFQFHFQIEATTLAGSPIRPEPRAADNLSSPPALTPTPANRPSSDLPPSPPPPTPFEVILPADRTTPVQPAPPAITPVYPNRMPGEVWLQLVYLDAAGNPLPDDPRQVRDVAVFTIAPWLMLSNLRPAQVFYIGDFSFNQDTVRDVERALNGAGGVTLRKISSNECGGDPWVQDEFEIGYCWAVHNWMHVILHCKRSRGLDRFVREHAPTDDLGLFEDLTESDDNTRDSINYGGNLEVSPPVAAPTAAIGGDAAGVYAGGPDIPAQLRAPFGKIILGHSSRRAADDRYLYFLESQKVQPILPLDTSWLDVGHVDEFMIFVPASSGKRFKLLMASPTIATDLLTRARDLRDSNPTAHPLTRLLRGKFWLNDPAAPPPRIFSDDTAIIPTPFDPEDSLPAAITVDRLLSLAQASNEELSSLRLDVLQQRLMDGLNLDEEEVIPLPTYFDARPLGDFDSGGQTSAFTPGLVNLQVVNQHVLVPRPYGPRMSAADVQTILGQLTPPVSASAVRLGPFKQHIFWVRPEFRTLWTADTIAGFFADGGVTAAQIVAANPGKFDASSHVTADYTRLLIPEQTVDLFEAYTQIRLEQIGLTVHWIDDWYTYHRMLGEVHCGTNVKRQPPEIGAPAGFELWWDYYAAEVAR